MKTHAQFLKDFEIKGNSNLTIVGQYNGAENDIQVQCKTCQNFFYTHPHTLLKGSNCPFCTNQKIIKGINSFGDYYPDLVKYFVDKNQAYQYSSGSSQLAILQCPICLQVKKIPFSQLKRFGFNCSFCNTMSYPNKFLRLFIQEIKDITNISFEKTFLINNSYIRYDGLFNYNDQTFVIEMNGKQHYKECSYNNYNVNNQIDKDNIKKKFAEEQNFIFIEINCSKSEFNFIKENIINSSLSDYGLLKDINWNNILQNLSDISFLENICNDYEKNFLQIQELSNKYSLDRHQITKYLKQGKEIGLCNSYPRYINKTNDEIKVYNNKKEFIGVFPASNICANELNKIYKLNFTPNGISHVLSGAQKTHRGFFFVRGEEDERTKNS